MKVIGILIDNKLIPVNQNQEIENTQNKAIMRNTVKKKNKLSR